ncbi:hypothetical protein Q6322_27815 [Klebsiella pneumoniae]|nr:hypothetical protein [Klebsiella pneumoniae]MDP0907664.1 hypothetical protein [Klebsiella pneumoniae]
MTAFDLRTGVRPDDYLRHG